MAGKTSSIERRRLRVRGRVKRAAGARARLSVFRSTKHIYAQIIDDQKGVTLAAASSRDKDFSGKNGGNIDAAGQIGTQIAKRAQKVGIEAVVFDRGSYLYHGRVKALAEAARAAGLKF